MSRHMPIGKDVRSGTALVVYATAIAIAVGPARAGGHGGWVAQEAGFVKEPAKGVGVCRTVAHRAAGRLPARVPPLLNGSYAPLVNGWQPVGLSGGGAMFTPVISRADPNLMMINCDMSGCYISTDGGRLWSMVPYRQRRSHIRCKPAMHPTSANIILAPDGYGGLLKRTSDMGNAWREWGRAPGPLRGEILYHPDDPSLVMAGLSDGVAISRDGGRTWAKCRGPHGEAIAFHFDRTSRPGRRVIFAATKEGIWRSDNRGTTWTEKTQGLPWTKLWSFAGGSNPETGMAVLYCSIESRVVGGRFAGGIYRSEDRGEHWQWAMGPGINLSTTRADPYAAGEIAQYKHLMTTDVDPRRVYVTNSSTGFWPPYHDTVHRSDDAGRTWRWTLCRDPRGRQRRVKVNAELNYVTASTGQCYKGGEAPFGAAICPSDPDRVLINWGQVFITYDGGRSWMNGHTIAAPGQPPGPGSAWICNGLVVTTTWHYYIDPFEHNRHYIAYTDIGFARSTDGGLTWRWWEKGRWSPWRNTCYELAFDPEIPGKMWGAFSDVHDIPNANIISGRHWRPGGRPGGVCLSTDFGQSWKPTSTGLPLMACTSVVVDPRSPRGRRTLYAAIFQHGVYKSTDDGKTWVKKSDGLGSPVNMNVCRVALHSEGTLFALVTARIGGFRPEGAGLYRSRDGAESWERITNDPVFLWPKDFEVDPRDSDTIFLGAARAGRAQQQGLYRTTNGGESWKKVAEFGREHFGAYFHPQRPGWVYATMCEGKPEYALWLSTDNGDTWRPFRRFPFSNTQRVAVGPDDPDIVYVTTFGGSVWKGPAAPR